MSENNDSVEFMDDDTKLHHYWSKAKEGFQVGLLAYIGGYIVVYLGLGPYGGNLILTLGAIYLFIGTPYYLIKALLVWVKIKKGGQRQSTGVLKTSAPVMYVKKAEQRQSTGILRVVAPATEEEEKRNGVWELPRESIWHGIKYIIGGFILLVLFSSKANWNACCDFGGDMCFCSSSLPTLCRVEGKEK